MNRNNEIWKAPENQTAIEKPTNMGEFFDGFAVLDPIAIPKNSGLKGALIGPGPTIDYVGPDNTPRSATTWKIDVGHSIMLIYGSAMLDDRLRTVLEDYGPGTFVAIWRGETVMRRNGRQLAKYVVGVKGAPVVETAPGDE